MRSANYRDEKFLKQFGLQVRAIRIGNSMSQQDLANKLGFSQPQIVMIEKGRTDTSICHANAIAKALNIDISLLFMFDNTTDDQT